MPELPDLTIYAQNLRRLLCGKRVVSADVFSRSKVNATPEAWRAALEQSCLTDISRQGKEMLFRLDNGQAFSVHLMLMGKFSLLPTEKLFSVNSKIVALGFGDGQALCVSDEKHLCNVKLNPPPATAPDALGDDFSYAFFERAAHKKATANVKAFLIDQKVVRGIGNAYADEILYAANISPHSTLGKIPPEYLYRLYASIGAVLRDAIAQLERLVPDSISGEERSFLRVHRRDIKRTDDGDPIRFERVCNKGTYFTDRQILFV